MPPSVYIKCSYIKRDGSVCGKGSVTGLCGVHSRCNPQRACRLCGKGTQSASGICATPGPCKTAQHTAMEAAKRVAKRRAEVEAPLITADDLDGLVDELTGEFEELRCA